MTETSTPLDAPLFRIDTERGIEYWGCKAVLAAFTLTEPVDDLVPRGLHLDEPAIGAVLVADYGMSTLGPYCEYVSLLRVTDDEGAAGMYIPSIYVTNDAALAAGRELLGAPKKLASITVEAAAEAVVGTLARPGSCDLARVVVAPVERLDATLVDALIAPGTPFYSLRHLPGPPGGTAVHELVRWYGDLAMHTDAWGDPLRFTGPVSVTYPTRSAVDPVHRLGVGTMLGGAYLEFDMRLRAGGIVWSETVAAVTG
ncbi:MAG: acetoacetate decarboxylase family protein [Actinobacteria bacterium]|nr:acetoacetate decarboxylase family protein [Actinomycetota bacterium]